MKSFRSVLFTLISIVVLFSCKPKQTEQPINPENVWVYISFNLLEGDSTDELFSYYGTMYKKDYINLAKNKLEGDFIILNNIRYDGFDDKLHIYESEFESDEFIINKATIRGIDLLKMDPAIYYPDDELAEEALKYKRGVKVFSDSLN